jgi:MoxR-like ATPase
MADVAMGATPIDKLRAGVERSVKREAKLRALLAEALEDHGHIPAEPGSWRSRVMEALADDGR